MAEKGRRTDENAKLSTITTMGRQNAVKLLENGMLISFSMVNVPKKCFLVNVLALSGKR